MKPTKSEVLSWKINKIDKEFEKIAKAIAELDLEEEKDTRVRRLLLKSFSTRARNISKLRRELAALQNKN